MSYALTKKVAENSVVSKNHYTTFRLLLAPRIVLINFKGCSRNLQIVSA